MTATTVPAARRYRKRASRAKPKALTIAATTVTLVDLNAIINPYIENGVYYEKGAMIRLDAVQDLLINEGRLKESRELVARVLGLLLRNVSTNPTREMREYDALFNHLSATHLNSRPPFPAGLDAWALAALKEKS